jgi:hypothetical protein
MFVGATRCHAWSAERNTFVSAFQHVGARRAEIECRLAEAACLLRQAQLGGDQPSRMWRRLAMRSPKLIQPETLPDPTRPDMALNPKNF